MRLVHQYGRVAAQQKVLLHLPATQQRSIAGSAGLLADDKFQQKSAQQVRTFATACSTAWAHRGGAMQHPQTQALCQPTHLSRMPSVMNLMAVFSPTRLS